MRPLSIGINEAAVRRYWKGRDPFGTRIDLFGDEPATVVGVVGDVRQHSLGYCHVQLRRVAWAPSPPEPTSRA